jgi:predicted dehydrogenase
MSRLRAAVIGLGIGEQHLLAYQRHPHCEVAAVCDLSEAKLAQARAKYPGIRTTRHEDEVLLDPAIDVVSIASFDDAHARQVVKALDAGKHVFVEKPLCLTGEELQTIRQAWRRHDGRKKLASNLVLRAAPLYRWLKQRIEAGDLGEVYAFDGDYLYGRIDKITQGWRKDVAGYSVMAGGGVHLIDLFVWLTGQRPASVQAAGNGICTKQTAFRYDDYSAALLQCPSGLVARLSANFGCVHRHQHVLRVFGTRATFLYDDAGPRWHWTRDPAAEAARITLAPLPASKGDLLAAFVDAIVQDQDLCNETQEHLDVVSIILACDRAARTRSHTEVKYV